MRWESHRVVQGPAPEGGKGRVTGNSRESCVQGVIPVTPQEVPRGLSPLPAKEGRLTHLMGSHLSKILTG